MENLPKADEPRIIVVGGTKGGAGKSTVATHLAVKGTFLKKKTMLIDGDRQRSTTKIMTLRRNQEVQKSTPRMSQATGDEVYHDILGHVQDDYDLIIIDATGTDNAVQRAALLLADTLVLPFSPNILDMMAHEEIGAMLKQVIPSRNPQVGPLHVLPFITRGYTTGTDNDEAIEYIEKLSERYGWIRPEKNCILNYRKAFARCFEVGDTVYEYRPPKRPRDSYAVAEMDIVCKWIFSPETWNTAVSKETAA